MLTRLKLQNFKIWEELDIGFAPRITGLFGTNSSGKSSIIQFLLMLKQTKDNPDRRLTLDFGTFGNLVNLGSFREVIHGHDESKRMAWTLGWESPGTISLEDTRKQNAIVNSRKISNLAEIESLGTNNGIRARYVSYLVKERRFGIELDTAGERFDLVSNLPAKQFEFIKKRGRPIEIPGPIKTHLFPDQAKTLYQNTGFLSDLEVEYERLMDNIFYLGPLREYPRRDYNWSGSSPVDVGIRGQLTMNAIIAAEQRGRVYKIKGKRKKVSFNEVVAYWLKKMGLVHSFEVHAITKGAGIYRAQVQQAPDGPEALITDVGFGVSQVLPVIVLLNHVPEKSTVMFEQPEIHLHPAIQSNLADVMVGIAETRDLQLIVETHSEHFLRRLQRRIAEGKLPVREVKIFAAQMDMDRADLQDLQLDMYGAPENWPDKFFGDDLEETIATQKAVFKRKTQPRRKAAKNKKKKSRS